MPSLMDMEKKSVIIGSCIVAVVGLPFVTVNIPDLKDSEFLVRNIWMSVDPYMRWRL
jgi:NADPH-dependent curcumin reductase CurA